MKKIIRCPKCHKELTKTENGWGVGSGIGKIEVTGCLYYCEKCNEYYPPSECIQESYSSHNLDSKPTR